MRKVLVVSIKPEFAEKIFNGQKSIELRKSAPNVSPGDIVVIYSTHPVKAVIGICQVKEIIKMQPSLMWSKHNDKLGIDKKRFQEYFFNTSQAVGIVLTAIYRLQESVSLVAIRKMIPMFQPPQTFRYYNKSKVFKSYIRQTA